MKTFSQTAPTALVTGGSRGIGRATALALARDGYQVILTYVSRPEEAMNVAELINAGNSVAAAYQLNVGDAEGVKAFFKERIKDQVNLTCLVNNAGITKDGLLIRMKEEDFDDVISVNLKGAYNTMRKVCPMLARQRWGRIINLSSIAGINGNAGQVNYSASKAGLIGMTKSAAREFAGRGITVNAIAPGFIATDMTQNQTDNPLIKMIPLGRMGRAEDVAEAAGYLATAEYVTGEVLRVDGGMCM